MSIGAFRENLVEAALSVLGSHGFERRYKSVKAWDRCELRRERESGFVDLIHLDCTGRSGVAHVCLRLYLEYQPLWELWKEWGYPRPYRISTEYMRIHSDEEPWNLIELGSVRQSDFGFHTSTDPSGAPNWPPLEDALLRCLRFFDAYKDAERLLQYGAQLETGVDILMISTCFYLCGRYEECIDYSARFGWTGQTKGRMDDVVRRAREKLAGGDS